MAWLSHLLGLDFGIFLIGWRAILIGLHWVTLGGIGIARGYSRTDVHVSRETTPPINPILLDNNNWLGHDPHCVNSINVL